MYFKLISNNLIFYTSFKKDFICPSKHLYKNAGLSLIIEQYVCNLIQIKK